MNFVKQVCGGLLALVLSFGAHATTISQDFTTDWSVSPTDSNSKGTAMKWQYAAYQGWDGSLGTLNKVTVQTEVSGRKEGVDVIAYRSYFLTGGGNQIQYQYTRNDEVAAGTDIFSQTHTFVSGIDFSLHNFANSMFLPVANYYFESKGDFLHTITAHTILTYDYTAAPVRSDVPEPLTVPLFMIGAAGLMAARKRRAAINRKLARL